MTLKDEVCAAVDEEAAVLAELAARIHAAPELKFEEHRASAWLADFLEARGFAVERGAYGLPTAFAARIGSGEPRVAVLCEYDALPGVGHACGHNLIAAAGAGAGAALARVVGRSGGTVVVLGTPGEEGGGGKVMMARAGAFEGVDAAMMVHPAGDDLTSMRTLAVTEIEVVFHGRAAHASAAPQEGINALDALVLAYQAIAQLRQHIRSSERVHGIITDGGQAPNVVPERAAGLFYVRAATLAALAPLRERVLACFEAGARAAGASFEVRTIGEDYADMRDNPPLVEAWAENMSQLGRSVRHAPGRVTGSTDMGNVSHLVPSIHPMIAVAPPQVPLHSAEFAAWTNSAAAQRAILDGARALAMTALDVLTRPELRQVAWRELRKDEG